LLSSSLALRGIIPPLVTPLSGRDQLDRDGLSRLIEYVLAGGVQGLFILGSTGEAPSLGYRLRGDLIDAVCKQVNGRVPVLVGITDTAFVESVAVARRAADAGAAAVVLSTPYYFPAGQTELTSYVRNLLPELPLPLVLYNMPALTKVTFEIETLRKLADEEQIIGLKDSGGDLDYFAAAVQLKQIRPDWSILIGPEAYLPEAMALGGDGGVAGGANVIPAIFEACYQAAIADDQARLAACRLRILDFQRVYEIGKYPSRFIKGTKCCLSLLGLCHDFMAEPFHHFHEPERLRVRQILLDCFPELEVRS